MPDPSRLVRAYNQSAATLNLLRGFSYGGYGGLARVSQWNLDFMAATPEGHAYMDLAKRVDEAIQFMRACGMVRLLFLLGGGGGLGGGSSCDPAGMLL